MLKIFTMLGWAALAIASPASARDRSMLPDIYLEDRQTYELAPEREMNIAQDQSQVQIAPSEAASIARSVVPGAKVVGVKLLPSGYYAVTLRSKGSVTRVMVNASDGSVN